MSLIWPSSVNPSPDGVVRFGRVMHWIGAIVGVALIVGAGALFVVDRDNEAVVALLIGIPGAVIFFLGRGLRYVFSGE